MRTTLSFFGPAKEQVRRRQGQQHLVWSVAPWLATVLLTLGACGRAEPGLSREKAEAVLKAYDYTEIELQAAPEGWSGTAIPASGGYRMNVTIDRNGVMQLQSCACGGKEPPAR